MKKLTVDAILFDMDGTLIDSTPGVLEAWKKFAIDYGFNAQDAARTSHGRRLYDTLKEHCGIDDEDKLQAEIIRFEEEVIKGGPLVLPGTLDLLSQESANVTNTPVRKADLMTNTVGCSRLDDSHLWAPLRYDPATNLYTPKALQSCNIPIPPVGCVTSNDVTKGKPHPDPYLAGAKQCGVKAANCLVVEDAPSGLRAGHAAGSQVLAVCTSHTRQEIIDSGAEPHFIVKDLTKVSAKWVDGKVEISIVEEDE